MANAVKHRLTAFAQISVICDCLLWAEPGYWAWSLVGMTQNQWQRSFVDQVCHLARMGAHTTYVVGSGTQDLCISGCYYDNRTEHVRSVILLSTDCKGCDHGFPLLACPKYIRVQRGHPASGLLAVPVC